MAVRPVTPPRPSQRPSPVNRPGGGGGGGRPPSQNRPGGGPGPGAGPVRYLPPSPPTTPFQPGAPPSPPINPFIAVPIIGGLLAGFLWDLFNQRPDPVREPPENGEEITAYPGGNGPFTIRYTETVVNGATTTCSPPGQLVSPQSTTVATNDLPVFGSKLRIGTTTGSSTTICGTSGRVSSTNVPVLTVVQANGAFQDVVGRSTGGVFPSSFFNVQNANSWSFSGIGIVVGGNFIPADQTIPGTETLPRPQAPVLPVPVPAVPAVNPAAPEPARVAPPVPGTQPVPRPAPAPGGLPTTTPSRPRAPGALPAASPVQTPRPTPALPQTITANGVRPGPRAPVPQTSPGTTFLPGGVSLPNNGPRPTPEGMATELGKLERKLELMLAPEGPLSPLELLNKVIDQVENIEFLIERLFPPEPYRFDPGAYQLAPICDRDAEGELVPPLEAPWAGGEGEFNELRQRLDALAQLIQHHKTLKQPACGGRGGGPHSNVTVHFESP